MRSSRRCRIGKAEDLQMKYEDIHSFVEANLIDRLGDTGKKLHTGRSRNDQVALDMRLYTRRKELLETDELLNETVRDDLLKIMEENTGYDHAGFYPFAEGTADHAGTSYGVLILKCSSVTDSRHA